MGAIGDEPSVELLPRLLVGPPRGGPQLRREGERHGDREDGGREAPAGRRGGGGAPMRHPDRGWRGGNGVGGGDGGGKEEEERGTLLLVARRGRGFVFWKEGWLVCLVGWLRRRRSSSSGEHEHEAASTF